MSTGFEGLLTDPEAFARSAPEQFNRVIQALEEFKNRRKKPAAKDDKKSPEKPPRRGTSPAIENLHEPFLREAPATPEKIVPNKREFSPRVVEFVESVKKSGDFWADAEKPTNGKSYRAALDKAQRRAEKSGDFDAEELKEIRKALIFENMRRNEAQARKILKEEGREILPLESRAKHYIITASRLRANVKEIPGGAEISEPRTVDRYRDGVWKQRRWYDANGDAEQDYDAAHDGKDVKETHIFPHIHAWGKGNKPKGDKGKRTPRERSESAFTLSKEIVKSGKLDK